MKLHRLKSRVCDKRLSNYCKKSKKFENFGISKSTKRPALFKKAVIIGAMAITEPIKSLNLTIEKEILRIFLIIAKRTRTPAMISTVLIM